MTPAYNFLKKKKIPFTLHEYEHDSQCTQFGLEAAAKLNLAPEIRYTIMDGSYLRIGASVQYMF